MVCIFYIWFQEIFERKKRMMRQHNKEENGNYYVPIILLSVGTNENSE